VLGRRTLVVKEGTQISKMEQVRSKMIVTLVRTIETKIVSRQIFRMGRTRKTDLRHRSRAYTLDEDTQISERTRVRSK